MKGAVANEDEMGVKSGWEKGVERRRKGDSRRKEERAGLFITIRKVRRC